MFGKVRSKIEQVNQHEQSQDYWTIVKQQFRKNRLAVYSLRFIYVLLFVALFANFIANNKPLVCQYQGSIYFPVTQQILVDWNIASWSAELVNAQWKDFDYDWALWPPVPYSPQEMDMRNAQYTGPFEDQDVRNMQFNHWLGTDEIGRDLLAGLIHGTRIAMLVGVVSMSIAALIGIVLGSLAGYFGDRGLKISRIAMIIIMLALPFAWFYSFHIFQYQISRALSNALPLFIFYLLLCIAIFGGIIYLCKHLVIPLERFKKLGRKVAVPVDILISRFIEIVIAIPQLLLILSIVAIAEPSILLVMAVIGLTSWTGIARFIRGELLRVRSLEYIEAARALGFPQGRILFRHAIPNALTPVLIAVAFGIAGAILIESSLSFLGIGVQAEVITWGKLLSLARKNPEAWWLAIFPGVAIFITVTVFNLIGEGLSDALDPRQKE